MCSVVAELVELSIEGKSNIEVEARSVQHDTLSAAGGLTSEESLRRVGINLLGGALSNQQQHRMLEELVAGVSHVMLAKGFSSIQQGIQNNEVMDKKFGLAELLFPCAVSARGFYFLFQDYHWEGSNYQCVVLSLKNKRFQEDLSIPDLGQFFASSSAVTPANISSHFPSQSEFG